MKAYKGIIRISCSSKKGCVKNLKKNVQPGCLDCPHGIAEILDLDEKVLFEYRHSTQLMAVSLPNGSPKARTGKRKKKK